MTTPDTGPPSPGGRRGGLGAWVKRNKGAAAAIGAVGLVAAIYIAKKGPAAAANPNATNTPATPSTYAGSGVGNDAYAGEMAQLQDLLNAYTAGTLGGQLGIQPAPAPTPPKPVTRPPSPVFRPPVRIRPHPPGPAIRPGLWVTVGRGQTLASLSQKYFGTSNRSAIAHANDLGTGAGLRAGQRLYIPAR